MSSVEQELWNIFTYYTLHGNPLDPEHLRATQFVKLCRDCQIVGTTPITEADVNVSYTAEVKRQNRVGIKRMNYSDFLTALMKLSVKVYRDALTVDDAFQRLLMENVLPLASRRCPDAVDVFLEDEEVAHLFAYYADAMLAIFQFYASNGEVKAKARAAPRAKGSNTMKDALGYQEFLKFAADFSLSSSVILSTLEIGDIFLSSIKPVDGEHAVRKLTFREFREALVRCALVAYSKISDASIIDKIRGLFLYMWRSINKSIPKAFDQRRSVSTYHGDLLAGAMLFNKRFTAQWARDGYRDYLSPEGSEKESGKQVLSRLLLRTDDRRLTATGSSSSPGRSPGSTSAAAAVAAMSAVAAGAGAGAGAGRDLPPSFDDDARRYGGSRDGLGAGFGGTPGSQDRYMPPSSSR